MTKGNLRDFLASMKIATRLLVSAACSVFVLGLLLSLAGSLGADVSPADIATALRSAIPALVALYALCQLAQALARAQRARVLLRASLPSSPPSLSGSPHPSLPPSLRGVARSAGGSLPSSVPSLFHTLLVTFVRGACADMLPARLGELSYVAMLNRGCAVPAADCLSSLSIGLLFDFLALLAVLAVAIPAAAQGLSLVGSMVMLAAICVVGMALLFVVLPVAAAWRWERLALFRWRPVAWLLKLMRDIAAAVEAVRRGRVAGRVLTLSLAVRAAKYVGLYLLFVAVTRSLWPALSHASVSAVLVALIAAEGAASLPVPTFLSFGSYEAGGLAALTALGFPAGDSLVAMMAMHILSQIVDYSLGGLAFLVFSWTINPTHPANSANGANGANGVNGVIRAQLCRLLLAFLLLLSSLAFTAWQVRAIKKRGRLTAPPKGEAVQTSAAESAARDAAMRAFGGKIVWSSNRSGSHNLWILDGPGAVPRRLTRSNFTDTYPRFSPDGKRIAFSRSIEPWVSQRNFDKWDTWVLDLATGEESLVATNAYQACWCDDASVAFVRAGGTRLVRSAIHGGAETVLLESGIPPLGSGVLVTLPDYKVSYPQFTLTLRGKHRATATYSLQDAALGGVAPLRDRAGGCQMVWRKDPSGLGTSDTPVWIDHPGRMKNAIYAFDEHVDGPVVLLDADDPWSHEYFPRFADNGRWLVYGASTGGHEQDSADYEIFLWDTSDTNLPPARLTFHTGNDCWPDIWAPR